MASSLGKTWGADRGLRTIRFRIITLVLLILAPFLCVFAWMAFNLATARMALIELSRRDNAENIMAQTDREVAHALGMLTGLGAGGAPDVGNADSFRQQARALLNRPELQRIWVFDRQGKIQVTGDGSEGADEIAMTGSDLVDRIFAGKQVVSTVRGAGLDDATLVISVPISEGGQVVAGLAAEVRARLLDRILPESGIEPGWVVAVVDRNGRFVMRSIDAEGRVGQMARPELKAAANSREATGTFENVTWEGVPMLNSFRRSSLTDWTTVVAVPKAIVEAPLKRNAAWALLGGSGALLLSLAAAFAYATRISEPIRSLGRMATAFAKGQSFRKTRYPLAELEEVQHAFETAATESAHLSALVASSGDAIMSMNLDGTIRTWNPAAERLFGYTAEEIVGKPKSLLVPAEAIDAFQKQLATVVAGEHVRSETVRRHRDGTRIAVSVEAAPIRRPDGKIIATSSILHDITERIANEEHRLFLMREIAHRSKNQLAIIQSIATQTARTTGSTDAFLKTFRSRLQGLSASHDLLLKQDWRGAPIEDLVRSQIEIFVGENSSAVDITGPPAILTAAAAEAIGLAIHELATNSAKYGALSVPSGRVAVAWEQVEGADGETGAGWKLTWQEMGGPTVTPPVDSGFGTQVIKRTVAMAVQGQAEVEYLPSGLIWTLSFPVAAMRLLPYERATIEAGSRPNPGATARSDAPRSVLG